MEVGQGTAQELVAEEESNCLNIDSFVQEPHRECMPETVEGDMLADTCSRDELGDFMVEDVRRQGGEDGPSILDCSPFCHLFSQCTSGYQLSLLQ